MTRGPALLFILILFSMFLHGCASHSVPKIVQVPVPVTCKTPAPKEPDYPVAVEGDGLYVRVQKKLAEVELRKAYEKQLLAWGGGCNPA